MSDVSRKFTNFELSPGADWGLVVNPAEAVLKTSDDDGVLTPEEPMEVVEAEAVSFNSEEKEGNAAMGNEQ